MSITVLFICGLVMGSAALLTMGAVPLIGESFQRLMRRRVTKATAQLSGMFVEVPAAKLLLLYVLPPVLLGAVGVVATGSFAGGAGGAVVGLALPGMFIKGMRAKRRGKFNEQLVDGLMILSSSLKAGLSMLQSIEIVVEEMPPPIAQEFGLVIKENKMGMPLNESLERLKKRMTSDDLNLVITAILVARETGGDVTEVFTKLIETIRERKKVMEKVKTLTIQGKLQGIVMSLLPVGFAAIAFSMNPRFFDLFLENALGQALLGTAVGLELIGILLIWKFSRVKA